MKIKPIVWVLLAGAGIFTLVSFAKKSISKIAFSFGSIKFTAITIENISYQLNLDVVNNNDYDISGATISGGVYYGGEYLASFSSQNITLPKKSTTSIQLAGAIPIISSINNLYDIIVSKKFDTKFKIKSNVFFSNVVIPVNYDLSIL